MTEIWRKCWNCGEERPHSVRASDFFPRVIEMFKKSSDGKVESRVWAVFFGAYQFGKCNKCLAPSLFVDEYWPTTESPEEANRIKSEVLAAGECRDAIKAGSLVYPGFNEEPFPKWTQDLEETQMLLFWEVYSAISLGLRSLAMMGFRAIIDTYATRQIGDVGGFKKKLDTLLSQQFINKTQHEHLDAVIEAGNASGHRGHRPEINDLKASLRVVEELLAKERFGDAIEKIRAETPPRP